MKHCSEEVRRATNWLAERLAESIYDVNAHTGFHIVYALHKARHPDAKHLLSALEAHISGQADFWTDLAYEGSELYLYMHRMGLADSDCFQDSWADAKSSQTLSGHFLHNDYPAILLPLACIEPTAPQTKLAISYFADHWQELPDWFGSSPAAIGLQALLYYAPGDYHDLILTLAERAKARMVELGPLASVSSWLDFRVVCEIVEALCAVHGPGTEVVREKVKEIKRLQEASGAWPSFADQNAPLYKDARLSRALETTTAAVLALISAGEGLKVPVEELERQERLFRQRLEATRGHVVATSPMDGVAEIRESAQWLIDSAKSRLWICSRFITEFYTNIIRVSRDNTNMDIRVITIPLKEAKGAYVGHGKKFVEPAYHTLQRTLESRFKSAGILHARCIISDDRVLVSSADLTREQLEHELNLGLWTSDPEVLVRVASFFERWWNSI